MTESNRDDVTLYTLHEDLTAGFTEMRSGFAGVATRESSEEIVRLLREGNRLNEARFTQLDVGLREQHLETQQALHALVEGQRLLIDGQRTLIDGQHMLIDGQRGLSADIKALIARIDVFLRGRDNGEPAA